MFGVIFFRLWYLQVLSGEQYVQQANANRVRDLPIPAPRGRDPRPRRAADRHQPHDQRGADRPAALPPAVERARWPSTRSAWAPPKSPTARRSNGCEGYEATLAATRRRHTPRGAPRLRRPAKRRRSPPKVADPAAAPLGTRARTPVRAPRARDRPEPAHDRRTRRAGDDRDALCAVTIKTDAGAGALTVLAERQNEFPGVVQQPVSIRAYPLRRDGRPGARPRRPGLRTGAQAAAPSAASGRARSSARKGSSTTTTAICAGAPGWSAWRSTPPAIPCRARSPPTRPTAGHSLKLTLDLGLQKESEKALLKGIEHAHAGGKPADAGAFVAIDPRNGEVLAIGSYPTFNPNRFAKPLTPAEYKRTRRAAARPAGRSPTARSTAPIRQARRSSRSPRWRRSKPA